MKKSIPVMLHILACFVLFSGTLLASIWYIDSQTRMGSFLMWSPFYLVILYLFTAWRISKFAESRRKPPGKAESYGLEHPPGTP